VDPRFCSVATICEPGPAVSGTDALSLVDVQVHHGPMSAADGPDVDAEAELSRGPAHVSLQVNGVKRSLRRTGSLLSALRDQVALTGAKPGCGEGACGSCTVLVDGDPVRACQRRVEECAGTEVTTVESLALGGLLHPVQQAFVEVAALQCGYCTPAMVLSVAALLARDPDPGDGAIDSALAGNVCRCGCYLRIRRAVHRGAELVAQLEAGGAPRLPVTAASDSWEQPDPSRPAPRPARPWDLCGPADRDWFDVLGDGLVVVLPAPPAAPGMWSSGGGAWLHVGADAMVTAFTGKVDVGQDNRTALRLLVAEELQVPLSRVRLAMGDTDLCPYDIGTFGSRSMPDAGTALRQVAAFARGCPPVPVGSRRVEVVSGEPVMTPPVAWRVAGTAHTPPGAVDSVTGARRFVSDLSVPGIWHGAVLRPPVLGARLRDLDATAVEGRPGVLLVRTPDLVAVLAAEQDAARSAVADLRAQWDVPTAPSNDSLESFLRSHPTQDAQGWEGPFHRSVGDVEAGFAGAELRLDATYTTAFVAPAALEPRAAVAVWDDQPALTVWVGTQTPFLVRAELAAALDVGEQQVRVVVPPTGGGFGGKHGASVALEAATLARHAGRPVRVAWTRHEEFTAGTVRPAAVIDVSAGVSASGDLTAWRFTNINSGAAAITTPYRVPNQRIEYQPAASPLSQGSYRALAATANNFARESHIDELASRLGRDPLEFRLHNLADERLGAVLQAVAARVGWAARAAGSGWGIACGLEKDGRVATAARVGLDPAGRLRVLALATAYECGALVNPETVTNQIEGAMAMGLGGTLFESVQFTDGVVTNGTFTGYRVPRFHDIPPVEVILVNRPDLPSAGAGETPMIAVAPAVANAVFDATGQRLRSLPLGLDSS
jgi:nicotinate dehydrogenase subunit B